LILLNFQKNLFCDVTQGYRYEKSMAEWAAFNNSDSGNASFSYRRMLTKSACAS
jgi:hypothetical protein